MTNLLYPLLVLFSIQTSAQSIYISTSSRISFFAGTPVEDIDAVNERTISFLNTETGEVTISIPNKEFHFKQSLMEDHFNENYMESDKFPKSEFKGKISDIQKVNWDASTLQTITVVGVLTIHGVSKERTLTVSVRHNDHKIEGEVKFNIPLAEHNIERPKILWEKLSDNVEVHAKITYEPYKK